MYEASGLIGSCPENDPGASALLFSVVSGGFLREESDSCSEIVCLDYIGVFSAFRP